MSVSLAKQRDKKKLTSHCCLLCSIWANESISRILPWPLRQVKANRLLDVRLPHSSQTGGAGLTSGELLALRLPHSSMQSHVVMKELPMDGGGTIPGLGMLLGSAYPTGQECISSTVWDPHNSWKLRAWIVPWEIRIQIEFKRRFSTILRQHSWNFQTYYKQGESHLKSNSQVIFEILSEKY